MSDLATKGALILSRLNEEDRRAVIEAILNVPSDVHFDRVARINAPFVLAKGETLYGDQGYRNPGLLDGCYVVIIEYLRMMALDHGVCLQAPE